MIISNTQDLLGKFSPQVPGSSNRNHAATIKSVMEVIRMKKTIDAMNSDPQLALAQILLGKVIEESCLWVSTVVPPIVCNIVYCY
jgi:hypothetical protein